MEDEREYGYFDDDAEDVAVEEASEVEKKKKRKKKIDREGSRKHKKGKGKLGKFITIVLGGGIVVCLAVGLLPNKIGPTTKPAPSAPQDDYYLTVNFTDVEKMDLDDIYIYSESGHHALVYMIEGTNDAMSICDNYVIEDAKNADVASTLTPLEGTELFESLLRDCNVVAGDKIDMLSFAGTEYYISVDGSDVRSKLNDSDCANIVSVYADEDGTTYDNLSDFLDAKANLNNLGKSK